MRHPEDREVITRRALLGTTFALAGAAALAGCGSPARAADPRVSVTGGAIRGTTAGKVHVFRGIPYAQPPIGENRFRSPRPVNPWGGTLNATRFGSDFIQPAGGDPVRQEDALYANVWTPSVDGGAKLPVVVYIHGGGWSRGAGSLPVYDGAALAERAGAVVVNFNYRLGAFGFSGHPALEDPTTGLHTNWGLQDQIALLHWVSDNAKAFGGDPKNITLVGTSAGGASTWQLSLLPQTRPLLRRIISISQAHVWSPYLSLTQDDATAVFDALAAAQGVSVKDLRAVPADRIRDWWVAQFAQPRHQRVVDSGRQYRGPVRDPVLLPAFDVHQPLPDIPAISVYTSTEGSFFTGPNAPEPQAPPTDGASLHAAFRDILDQGMPSVSDSTVSDAVALYTDSAKREGRPSDPLALWTELWGDALIRHDILAFTRRAAAQRRAPLYLMEYAHPVKSPYFGVPHESTSPFLFGTYAHPANVAKFGDGPKERETSAAFMDLVAEFVHGRPPASPLLPQWDPVGPDLRQLVLRDGSGTITTPTKTTQLGVLDAVQWGK
ncbi:Para-nitrobenzyl esterase [Mycobacteroides abscessus subsp. massiliense]|nr:Para-nitrobenzyl esterase [Mycobacteroides abscessus subsp. massiliense]SKH88609.1 Para-nitrobenzyl esterase [Mycobacteroides abscessus subsp. massiliense]SKJ19366.1 Para-nitrobenzyl esterase [Mycobacteroides abscessus subsp. massiliense]SKK60200.1 Para-nitrobenzyl esterase [Mycobacteroides abscessus subsp. massiliense]SKL58136.1 Para-nitrobenzyl esterase [Mycobacteroides abscessus subsp. massiliense]